MAIESSKLAFSRFHLAPSKNRHRGHRVKWCSVTPSFNLDENGGEGEDNITIVTDVTHFCLESFRHIFSKEYYTPTDQERLHCKPRPRLSSWLSLLQSTTSHHHYNESNWMKTVNTKMAFGRINYKRIIYVCTYKHVAATVSYWISYRHVKIVGVVCSHITHATMSYYEINEVFLFNLCNVLFLLQYDLLQSLSWRQ